MRPKRQPLGTTAPSPTAAFLRWDILRRAFLSHPSRADGLPGVRENPISRKSQRGFNLVPWNFVNVIALEEGKAEEVDKSRDSYVSYSLSANGILKLVLVQRVDNHVDLKDFDVCNQYNVDNTGLVCQWPSEEVLAYFCLTRADMFRSKRILELGSGYGLAGLVIAACTDASEVVISDGNPQVVDYVQRSIRANAGVFGGTEVQALTLHWNQGETLNATGKFDIIVASDCTFFKEFHDGLARTVKSLLKPSETSEALFFSPRRGNSLEKFLEKIEDIGLNFTAEEQYDSKIWELHTNLLHGTDPSWLNYDKDHFYPLMVRITFPAHPSNC